MQAYSVSLQCDFKAWRVVGPEALALDVPGDQIPSMGGAVRIAQVMLPKVSCIRLNNEVVGWLADFIWDGDRWVCCTAQDAAGRPDLRVVK